MLKHFFVLLCLQILVLAVASEKTKQATDGIYAQFKQNDYNVTVEWIELVSYEKPLLSYVKVTTFKYNRTCTALNFTYTLNADLGNEVEVVVQAYKFASNEYRHFPLRYQVNYCKAMTINMFGISRLLNCGNFTGCPVQKISDKFPFLSGTSHVCNWTPDQSQFPPLIPSGRYMAEIQGMYREKQFWLVRAYITLSRSIVKK